MKYFIANLLYRIYIKLIKIITISVRELLSLP